jgi:hypothetical protein
MSLAVHQHDNPESKSVAREVPADANLAPLSQSAPHDVESGKTDDTTQNNFTSKEKWIIVGLASFAALFR